MIFNKNIDFGPNSRHVHSHFYNYVFADFDMPLNRLKIDIKKSNDVLKMKSLRYTLPLFAFLLLFLTWDLLSRYSGWSRNVFPSITDVVAGMAELVASGDILRHSAASLFRVTCGFYLSIIFGIPLGVILGRSKIGQIFLNPVIQFLRPISPLAWIPLAMLWFGIGDKPAVFLIFLAGFFPLTVSTMAAVTSINSIYFLVAANFNLNQYEIATKIIIPAMLPNVFTALRITIGISWVVVVAAEMIAVKSGLGYLIIDSRNALRMDYVVDGMIVIGLIGLSLDFIMKRLGRIESLAWSQEMQES